MPDKGLGVGDLRLSSEVVFSRWLWKFINEYNLCRRVIIGKYGDKGLGWCSSKPNGLYRKSLQRCI